MPDYGYFLAINNGTGSNTLAEITKKEHKARLYRELSGSVHFDPAATRNGETQGLVLTSTQSQYKANVEALPDEDLCAGDLIYSEGNHWIMHRVKQTNPFQKTGVAWLCNHLFRWQNGTPEIIERWGVLDSGVYSSTRDGDATATTADKQYKVLLPYDADTAKLNMDKRFATGRMYDKWLREVLNVNRITGIDPVSASYGPGGHLLMLNVRSDDFVAPNDNMELMICDYIPPEEPRPDPDPGFDGTVTGPGTIRLGQTKVYKADYDVDWWHVTELEGVSSSVDYDADTLTLSVARNDDLIGEEIAVTAVSKSGGYARAYVEVID